MKTKRKILLVDDELTILLTLKAVLEISGYEVETAASAREGRSRIKTHEYDMVITDMRMESENAGLQVVEAAKNAPYRPAVAMLTAFPMSEGDPEAELDGHSADQMLVKPMNTHDLLTQLEALLARHEAKLGKATQPGAVGGVDARAEFKQSGIADASTQ